MPIGMLRGFDSRRLHNSSRLFLGGRNISQLILREGYTLGHAMGAAHGIARLLFVVVELLAESARGAGS